MVKKLTRHGNSDALVIDKPLMELLHLKSGGSVRIETDGRRLIIEPASSKSSQKELKDWLKAEDSRYGSVYRALSKPG